jgi:magnesium-transporting ATPase (P-type)
MISEILITGTYSSILCIAFLKLPLFRQLFRYDAQDKYLLTAFFGLFIFIDIFNSFNARTNRINILANITKNKIFLIIITFIVVTQIILIYYGGNLFRTFGLTFHEFQIMLLLSFSIIPIDFLRKLYLKKKNLNTGV